MKTIIILVSILFIGLRTIAQQSWYVDDISVNGDGSSTRPFNNIANAMISVKPGDTLFILPGKYDQSLTSVFSKYNGDAQHLITIKAYDKSNRPEIIFSSDAFLRVYHSYHVIEGLILNGLFSESYLITIKNEASHITVIDCEIKNTSASGIYIDGGRDFIIENCTIHHILRRREDGRHADAHGIMAYHQKNLRINNCEIYYCTGDGIQTDPSRELPVWDSLLVTNCKIWTGPLPEDAGSFIAGDIPGENAIDLKTVPENLCPPGYRPFVHIKNCTAWGFVPYPFLPKEYSDRAAFIIKFKVNCILENCIAYNNEIGFRLRGAALDYGSAKVTMINCIAYNNITALWPEHSIEYCHIYNCTFDKGQEDNSYFEERTSYEPSGFVIRNCLFYGNVPPEASHFSNIAANDSDFFNRPANDYHLNKSSSARDKGINIPEIYMDIEGNTRPLNMFDIGAYEYNQNYNPDSISKTLDNTILYPNPVNYVLNIDLDDAYNLENEYTFIITDLLGKEVVKKKMNGYSAEPNTISVFTLPTGLYFLTIKSKNLPSVILKFIKS